MEIATHFVAHLLIHTNSLSSQVGGSHAAGAFRLSGAAKSVAA